MKIVTLASLLLTTSLIAFPALATDAAAPAAPATDAKPVAVAPAKDAAPAKDYTIISLDGENLKYSDVMEVWKGLFQGAAAPDFGSFDESIKQNVLRGLVSERLIYKEAVKGGVDKSDEVKKRIEALQKQVVMQTFMEDKAKALVTDEQIKALYDEKLAATKGQDELKARHILVASEEEAKKIAADLKKGGDFDKVAKEKSTDKGSGVNGGELGWFSKDKMVPEFFEAANKLKKDEVSSPVKSSFGWHIIKLEDRRPLKPASFEESKESLKAELSNKAVQGYVEGLLKAANIKYFDESGKEKDFPRTLSALKPSAKGADSSAPAADAPAKADGKK